MSPTPRTSAIIILVCVAIVELSHRPVSGYVKTDSDADWRAFKTRYAKTYKDSSDEANRRNIRLQNLKFIVAHNKAAAAGKHTFTLGENAFTDLTSKEYQKLLGYKSKLSTTETRNKRQITKWYMPYTPIYSNTVDVSSLPSCVNWTQYGWVGEVLDQGNCGSCWSYSATAALQSQYYNLTGKMVQLSQQNLIDCSKPFGNDGCDGGNSQRAFYYVQKNGIESLINYPDVSDITGLSNYSCSYNSALSVTKLMSWRNTLQGSEPALQQAVALVGPISAALDGSSDTYQFYSEGVYSNSDCSQSDLNHAVLVAGYGVSNNQPYWLIQNSWGTGWGMDGYMLLARGSNMCGIANDGTFPVISQSGTPAAGVSTTGTCQSQVYQASSSHSPLMCWRSVWIYALLALLTVLSGKAM